MEKKAKAIGLFSGGLDSILAVKLMLEQGIEVEAVHFVTEFSSYAPAESISPSLHKTADELKIPLKIMDISEEFMDVVKKPVYGYGSGMNPCIDCRIFCLKKTKEYMEKAGASFIFTGEVLGQRPMSQRRDAMNAIERDAGVKGYLLRPLSARLFPSSLAESKGIVAREELLSLSGRSRKPQILLAEKLGIKDYPSSAGGCLLTLKSFARRMKDLSDHKPDFDLKDARLLKYGRHFRMSPSVKLVVSRNEGENYKIAGLKDEHDTILHAEEPLGPVALLRGADGSEFIAEAAAITARYALGKDAPSDVKVKYYTNLREYVYLMARPFDEARLRERMV